MDTQYYNAILSSLPTELSDNLRSLCTTTEGVFAMENFVRFILGANCLSNSSQDVQQQWPSKQVDLQNVLKGLLGQFPNNKRLREDGNSSPPDTPNSKRQRLSPPTLEKEEFHSDNGPPVYTLHSVSINSPIRKKVDITIHQNCIRFTNPSTNVLETTIPISLIRRAFILPTRGKSKAHWTVILISSDAPDRSKTANISNQDNPQIIFGLDASSTSPITTTSYKTPLNPVVTVIPKGSPTIPVIREFLSKIKVSILEPSIDVFKSVLPGIGNNASVEGIPGVEAYRAAKPGSLWFFKEGVLWGEGKPCEFWSLEDLIGKSEGLRMVGAGRTFSIILTRKSGTNDVDDDSEDVGEEAEISMIDAREKVGIEQWVRIHRHIFGKKKSIDAGKSDGVPLTIAQIGDDSDEEDEDFAVSSDEEHDGSSNSSATSDSDTDNSADNEDEAEEEDEEDENSLNEDEHPLLKPGAMPRMSKAAMDMAVDLVINDLTQDNSEDEEDELDD